MRAYTNDCVRKCRYVLAGSGERGLRGGEREGERRRERAGKEGWLGMFCVVCGRVCVCVADGATVFLIKEG